jgi:hypothetical protein
MKIIYTAIVVFGLTTLLGVYLISLVLRNKQTPKGIWLIHSLFSFAGLILLFFSLSVNMQGPVESTIVFVLAAFTGSYLFYKDITKLHPPKWIAVLQGILSILGYILLLSFAFK